MGPLHNTATLKSRGKALFFEVSKNCSVLQRIRMFLCLEKSEKNMKKNKVSCFLGALSAQTNNRGEFTCSPPSCHHITSLLLTNLFFLVLPFFNLSHTTRAELMSKGSGKFKGLQTQYFLRTIYFVFCNFLKAT